MPDPASAWSPRSHEYCAVHDQPLDWCKDAEACRGIMRSWGLYDSPGKLRDLTPPQPRTAYREPPNPAYSHRPVPDLDELARYVTWASFPKYELRAHRSVIEELKRVSAPDEPAFLGAGRFASIDVIAMADWEPGRYELTRDGAVVLSGILSQKPEAGDG